MVTAALAVPIGLGATQAGARSVSAMPRALPPTACVDGGATTTCDLFAKTGSVTVSGSPVNIWGYSSTSGGAAELPGPTLIVDEGDDLTINLTNVDLPSATSLSLPAQPANVPMESDVVGVTATNSTSYTLHADRPGTYVYEAGLTQDGPRQVAMGLSGALIVRSLTAGQAYDDATTAFDDEALLVLSEIDPALNAAPSTFDMRDFAPKYYLINGKAYPDTDAIVSDVGRTVLLRYVNAGMRPHSMGVQGLHQKFIAGDGNLLEDGTHHQSRTIVAETLAPGTTTDALTTLPGTLGYQEKFPVYDASLQLHNAGNTGFGGMLTFITVPGALQMVAGPITTNAAVSPVSTGGPAPTPVTLSATITQSPLGTTITRAEFFVDANPALPPLDGSGCDVTSGLTGTALSFLIPASGSPGCDIPSMGTGTHTLSVHGEEDGVAWGTFDLTNSLKVDITGPTTTKVTSTTSTHAWVSPSPTAIATTFSANASDSGTGGAAIAGADCTIVASLDSCGTIVLTSTGATSAFVKISMPKATVVNLGDGPHTLLVRTRDALGNWGATEALDFVVDLTPPTLGAVTVTYNAATSANRVSMKVTSTSGNVLGAEAFIDTIGTEGTGITFLPSDGAFNSSVETVYADIPLTTTRLLTSGTHSLWLHAKDGAGWGGCCTSRRLVISANSFETASGTVAPWGWSGGSSGSVSVVTGGALGSAKKLQVNTAGSVTDILPTVSGVGQNAYGARFYFNPNGMTSSGDDIFDALTPAPASTVFQVQYRKTGTTYQVRLVATRASGTAGAPIAECTTATTCTTAWFTITNNAWNAIEVVWNHATSGYATLYTGGVLRKTLSGINTGAAGFTVGSVQLGVLTGGAIGTANFDSFISLQGAARVGT